MKKLSVLFFIMAWALFIWSKNETESEPIKALKASVLKVEEIGNQLDTTVSTTALKEYKGVLADTTKGMITKLAELREVQLFKKIADLESQIENLREVLKGYTEKLPSQINRNDRNICDDEAFFEFETNRMGSILVKLEQGNNIVEKKSDFKTMHVVKFENLLPNQSYRIRAFIIDWNGNPLTDPGSNNPRIFYQEDFQTINQVAPPHIIELSSRTSENSIALSINPSQRSLIEIECFECGYLSGGIEEFRPIAKVGEIRRDDLGRPSGNFYGTGIFSEFRFENLKPDQRYKFAIKLMNEKGKESTGEGSNRVFATAPGSINFDFEGPINIQLGVLNYKISWQATVAPRSARFTASSDDGQILVARTGTITDRDIEVNLDLNAIENFMRSCGVQKPKYIVSMEDRNGSIKHFDFKLEYKIPTANEINSSTLSSNKKESLRRVLGARQNPDHRIKWRDLAATGLELLLTIL